jgi:hypothetical protein
MHIAALFLLGNGVFGVGWLIVKVVLAGGAD